LQTPDFPVNNPLQLLHGLCFCLWSNNALTD
jgi:hypothetical protein